MQEQRHIVAASCTACYKCMKKFFSYSRCYSNTQMLTELHLSSSDTLCANSPIISLACSTNLIVCHLHNVDCLIVFVFITFIFCLSVCCRSPVLVCFYLLLWTMLSEIKSMYVCMYVCMYTYVSKTVTTAAATSW